MKTHPIPSHHHPLAFRFRNKNHPSGPTSRVFDVGASLLAKFGIASKPAPTPRPSRNPLRVIRLPLFAAAGALIAAPLQADISADMVAAGISTRAFNFLEAHPRWDSSLKSEPTLATVLDALNAPDPTVPANAQVITTVAGLSGIVPGGVYHLDGDFVLSGSLNVRSNTTLYVSGSLTLKNQSMSNGWATKAVVDISGANIRVIGLDNAKIVSDQTASGFWVYDATNVLIQGFDIGFTEQAFTARWNVYTAVFRNNYCHDLSRRAIHTVSSGGAGYIVAKHNFIDWASDGYDFDYKSTNCIAFENVIVGTSRWVGYMEEGTQSSRTVGNLGVMAKWFGESHMMGICDNGTTLRTFQLTGRLTMNNYFVKNVVYGPTVTYTGRADYWAMPGTGDIEANTYGPIYMWGNSGYNYANQTGYIDYSGHPNLQPGVPKIADPNAPEVTSYIQQTKTTISAVEETVGAPRNVSAEADTYVWNGGPTINYGTSTVLVVKDVYGPGYDRISYLRFPLSSLTAQAKTATLKLKVTQIGGEGAGNRTVEVRQLTNDSWTETGTVWNNRPASTGTLIATITNAGTVGQTYSVDVTDYVNAQYLSDKKVSFVLIQPSSVGKAAFFGSRENAPAVPVIEIQ